MSLSKDIEEIYLETDDNVFYTTSLVFGDTRQNSTMGNNSMFVVDISTPYSAVAWLNCTDCNGPYYDPSLSNSKVVVDGSNIEWANGFYTITGPVYADIICAIDT